MLNKDQKDELIYIAKKAIETFVKSGEIFDLKIDDEGLNISSGAFVTIYKNGKLRGCVGRIMPSKEPLWQVVRDMAIAAASKDDRFSPVRQEELDDLDYEISVLSAPIKIDDWKNIELEKHGVIVQKGSKIGVFLPQVAVETDWELEEFLDKLCTEKAGLPSGCYKNDPEIILKVFSAEVF